MNGKENIIECEYMVEVVGSEGKKVLWEVVDNHVIEDPKNNDDMGLRVFDFNFIDGDEGVVVRGGFIEYHYLLMLTKIRPGD